MVVNESGRWCHGVVHPLPTAPLGSKGDRRHRQGVDNPIGAVPRAGACPNRTTWPAEVVSSASPPAQLGVPERARGCGQSQRRANVPWGNKETSPNSSRCGPDEPNIALFFGVGPGPPRNKTSPNSFVSIEPSRWRKANGPFSRLGRPALTPARSKRAMFGQARHGAPKNTVDIYSSFA